MAALYPSGYNPPKQLSIEEIFARPSVQMLHPEYQRRWRGLMVASGGSLGIGGAGRSAEQQKRVFLERHYQVSSGGCCVYDGKRYQLRKGAAHAAPPGRSFHEPVVYGAAAAVDAIGDLKWAAINCEAYGLEQATWGGEDWHFQFTEFPHSVRSWQQAGSPHPVVWKLPNEPEPPTPTPEPEEPVTKEEMEQISDMTIQKLMKYMTTDPPTGKKVSYEQLIGYTRHSAANADKQTKPVA